MRARVAALIVVLAASVLLLSSCSAVRCMFADHTTHEGELPPVTPEQAGWSPDGSIDGMRAYTKGNPAHPPVLLLHELPGLMPETVQFADSIVDRGYRVYMPLFFGEFGDRIGPVRQFGVCAGPSFNCFSKQESRVVAKLRKLRDRIASAHGDQSLGIIGMCLTGGMPIALANERVAAAVLSQPAIPMPVSESHKRSIGVSTETIQNLPANVSVLGIHFTKDCLAPQERFDALRQHLPSNRFIFYPVAVDTKAAHAVLSVESHGHHSSQVKEEAQRAVQRVFDFLDERLKPR